MTLIVAVSPVDLRSAHQLVLVSGGWEKLKSVTAARRLLKPSVLIVAERLALSRPQGLATHPCAMKKSGSVRRPGKMSETMAQTTR